MTFLMITSWTSHWDKLGNRWNNETLFTLPMIRWSYKNNLPTTPTKTIFIKKSRDGIVEKAWLGTTNNFRDGEYKGDDAIKFNVSIEEEINCPADLGKMPLGWHVLKEANNSFNREQDNVVDTYLPAFLKELNTTDWEKFEDDIFYLLRLLGINDIHKFTKGNNRGKADGFFIFNKRLAVLYDATLESDITKKKTQINNYIGQLSGDVFEHEVRSYTIKGLDKQIWIITNGNNPTKLVKDHDGIKVKNVSVSALLTLYKERLISEINSEVLLDKFKNI